MKKLKILHANNTILTNDSIRELTNLQELHCNDCEYITDINHMTKLRSLYAGGYCGLNNEGIKNLKLTYLDSKNNYKLTKPKSNKKLKKKSYLN